MRYLKEQEVIKYWNRGFLAGILSNFVIWTVLYKMGWL
jgi:hypothetical protein